MARPSDTGTARSMWRKTTWGCSPKTIKRRKGQKEAETECKIKIVKAYKKKENIVRSCDKQM